MEIQELPCFIYTDFFLKANNSVKSQQKMKIFFGCESGAWVLPIYEKNRVRKSHATVPLKPAKMSILVVIPRLATPWAEAAGPSPFLWPLLASSHPSSPLLISTTTATIVRINLHHLLCTYVVELHFYFGIDTLFYYFYYNKSLSH